MGDRGDRERGHSGLLAAGASLEKLDAIPIRSRLICESARSGKRVDLIHLIDVAIAGDARRDRRCRAHPEALVDLDADMRSEEHTSELQSLMRISYAVFCLKKKTK